MLTQLGEEMMSRSCEQLAEGAGYGVGEQEVMSEEGGGGWGFFIRPGMPRPAFIQHLMGPHTHNQGLNPRAAP